MAGEEGRYCACSPKWPEGPRLQGLRGISRKAEKSPVGGNKFEETETDGFRPKGCFSVLGRVTSPSSTKKTKREKKREYPREDLRKTKEGEAKIGRMKSYPLPGRGERRGQENKTIE